MTSLMFLHTNNNVQNKISIWMGWMLKFKQTNDGNDTPFDTSILDGISDPVLIVDEQELVIDYNKAYKRLLKTDPSKNSLHALTNNKNIKKPSNSVWRENQHCQVKYISQIR